METPSKHKIIGVFMRITRDKFEVRKIKRIPARKYWTAGGKLRSAEDGIDELSEFVGVWENISYCAKDLGLDRTAISRCLKGERKQTGGYKFINI